MKGVARSFLEGTRLFLNLGSSTEHGERKMVNLIEDWDVLEEYTGEKLGFYQILRSEGQVEVRVVTGKVGFRKEYEAPDDPELTRILSFCRKHQFIRISQNVRDEAFFK